ncbi:uncharacterized protein LOC127137632 [Lathyrus oleraceus]|uniref:uncharacterized protein LOC127137632 n=1 Tax=Pisum sativum TaxID=3888 RepID=UPI0021D21180|nr:uncharacterized protein LOC127137632 [Pisum sativum]
MTIPPVLKDGVAKWKFVIQRRVVVERELGKDVVDVKEAMDLIKVVGLLKIVVGFSQCYEGLVKEFIINIPEDIFDKNSKEFCKVYVRGRDNEGAGELEVPDNQVCREITARQVNVWPVKKHLSVGKLTIKYAILHKIRAANWVPTNHISTIANTLGRFIFVVGTKVKFDYVKMPIAFLSMISGIILTEHPGILCSNDLPSRRKPALFVHYKLFEGIRIATARKQSLEALIASLEQAEGENIDHANVSHEEKAGAHTSSERSANHDDTCGNSDSGADETASSSSTE